MRPWQLAPWLNYSQGAACLLHSDILLPGSSYSRLLPRTQAAYHSLFLYGGSPGSSVFLRVKQHAEDDEKKW